jgi:hypothetical protein
MLQSSRKHANRRSRTSQKQRAMGVARSGPSRVPRSLEVYAFDVGVTLIPTGSWQVQNGFCAIPSTAGVVDRQGLRVTPVAMDFLIQYRGDVLGNVGANVNDYFYRCIIFQARYASPINSDLMANTASIVSFYNISHTGQSASDANIKVLYDEFIPVHVLADSSHHRTVAISSSDLLVKDFRFVDFTAIDPLNGGIYLAFISDNTVATHYGKIVVQSRLLYTDA